MKTKRFFIVIAMAIFGISAILAAESKASKFFEEAKEKDSAGDFIAAIELYSKAKAAYIIEGKQQTAEYAQMLHNIGRAYLSTGDTQKGREHTMEAARLRESLFGKESKEYIVSINNMALSYLLCDELPDALKYQLEVITLCKTADVPEADHGMYLINLGRIYNKMGDKPQAVGAMEEALPKVEKYSDYYVYILEFLGGYYMDVEDNENAYRILSLLEDNNNQVLIKECNTIDCHLERAKLFSAKDQLDLAKDEFNAIFAMDLTASEKGLVYEKYADFLKDHQDFSQAAEYYSMASETLRNADGESVTTTILLQKSALHYYFAYQYDIAIDLFKRVIEIIDKYNYSDSLKSQAINVMGHCYRAKKDYDNAILTYNSLLTHLEKHGYAEDEYAKAYDRLATCERFAGRYDDSIKHYEVAIDLYGKLELYDAQQSAQNGLKMARAYSQRGVDLENDTSDNDKARQQRDAKLREVIRTSSNALEQGAEYMGKLYSATTLGIMAGSYALLGEFDNAIDYYEKYMKEIRVAIAESFLLNNPKERAQIWQQEASRINDINELISLLPQDRQDLYSRACALVYDGQLLAKGILLTSNIEFDKIINRYGNDEMRVIYDVIKGNLAEIKVMRASNKPLDDILALSRKTDALQLDLSRKSAQFADYTEYLKLSLSDVLNALGDDASAIEFVTLNVGVIPDQDIIAAVVLNKYFPFGCAIPIGFVKQIKDILSDPHKYNNEQYGAAIWSGILACLPTKKVYFAPDGLINNIAIENLLYNGKPISQLLDLTRVSSTKEICRKHEIAPLKKAALFGDVDYAAVDVEFSEENNNSGDNVSLLFSDLAETRREINEIRKCLVKSAARTDVFLGSDAKKSSFLSTDNRPIDLLHIATHGAYLGDKTISDDDAMAKSILAFAGANIQMGYRNNSAIVNAAEIANMSLYNCDLVVLSACESGIGKLGDDGVFGLQRGFKNAGVKTLLVSLDRVSDDVTADLMISFYNHLLNDNVSKREALTLAQTDIRNDYPDDDSWASFILIDAFN